MADLTNANGAVPAALRPPTRLLMGPGPSDVAPRVLQAMAAPLVGHLDPYFLQIMNQMQQMLRQVYQTQNPMTLAISGTGMAGMETCLSNLLEPCDTMLVCVNGVFGKRMVDMAQRISGKVVTIEVPWGQVFDLQQIRAALQEHRPKALGIVHAETSTGAWQPVAEMGKLCHEFDTLFVLDTVTSLAGVPVAVDEWEVDAVYSGTQKCLSCPPGLSPVSISPRALEVIRNRQTKVQSWYLDLNMLAQYWGSDRVYHHTAPISMNFALYEALRDVVEEGLPARWERHRRNHLALKAGLAALGIEYTATPGHQLPTLNAVRIPEGVDDAAVRKTLLEEFGIEIGAGLGDFKGKVWRIGLMGASSRASHVFAFLGALEEILARHRYTFTAGASLAAATAAYNETMPTASS